MHPLAFGHEPVDNQVYARPPQRQAMPQDPATIPSQCDPVDGAFYAYGHWAHSVLGALDGVCLLDGGLGVLEACGTLQGVPTAARVRALGWLGATTSREPISETCDGRRSHLLPVESAAGELLGVLALECAAESPATHDDVPARLQPLLACLSRQLEEERARQAAMRRLTERSGDLEWLLELAAAAPRTCAQGQCLHELLEAAAVRTRSGFAVLYMPDKHLHLRYRGPEAAAEELSEVWRRSRAQMSAWVRQKRRPLVLNGRGLATAGPCKILLAPIADDDGPVGGVLALFRPAEAADYRQRHLWLAGHLGRLLSGMVEFRFDAMTGLYTREGLEQMYARLAREVGEPEHSVVYLDIDQMHVVNELYGFEIGNELLVRVAEVLAPPHLPPGALAARVAADRFAVVLPGLDTPDAAAWAGKLQETVSGLAIGPVDNPIDVSASCGIAPLLAMPQGLGRALAAAELACKTAKKQGRNRIKVDSCEDGTMLRRHVDAVMVGQLRTALKAEQLLLYAQRIVPLSNAQLPGGYEILVRLNDPIEGLVQPGALMGVASRYQLLSAIDRWVIRKTLQMLAVRRGMLESSGIGISINLSGQSMGDEAFTRQLGEELRAAHLPAGTITFEITEQAAVRSLARAEEMIRRLSPWSCRFALDDFGTGANSLTYLNALPISRVKIDGSFVRDILTNPRSQATVRGIVELARGFRIDTVAEFVESEAIAERLTDLGVDYAQGYAFGRPEPFDAVLEALQREDSQRLPKLLIGA